ncbi:DeoR/GlpR family DNA-binding transcription regulator [Aerococcus suis]|uniref:Lactose phosphotransferase system repressor n=1 Tax=Aerococcus suis TaxID=371602 RepID=A0A1W1ZCX9_9LACT|nr:DeoR/GlpR family DNA-binding transcription regulator [Aerococcus suis]SMC46206.1 transcriptional regulator, DeoR family [Aerococcus suis]
MIKEERLKFIKEYLQDHKILQVQFIVEQLGVTDMTVRRDLKILENEGFLQRIHGGAKLNEVNNLSKIELSHREKKNRNLSQKHEIAKKMAAKIEDNDIIFLGTSTTTELVYDYLDVDNLKIITNSIFVFDKFKNDDHYDLILIGGNYRSLTGAFIGTIASDFMKNIYIQKAFIGVNALDENYLYNANEDEGDIQRIALDNAKEKYIVADDSKFGTQDFYRFYEIGDADQMITNKDNQSELLESLKNKISIIK